MNQSFNVTDHDEIIKIKCRKRHNIRDKCYKIDFTKKYIGTFRISWGDLYGIVAHLNDFELITLIP